MIVKIARPRLAFVRLGPGKVHAMDTERQQDGSYTLCGRAITAEAELLLDGQRESQMLCQRCLASLGTYRGSRQVIFEQQRPVPGLGNRLF